MEDTLDQMNEHNRDMMLMKVAIDYLHLNLKVERMLNV